MAYPWISCARCGNPHLPGRLCSVCPPQLPQYSQAPTQQVSYTPDQVTQSQQFQQALANISCASNGYITAPSAFTQSHIVQNGAVGTRMNDIQLVHPAPNTLRSEAPAVPSREEIETPLRKRVHSLGKEIDDLRKKTENLQEENDGLQKVIIADLRKDNGYLNVQNDLIRKNAKLTEKNAGLIEKSAQLTSENVELTGQMTKIIEELALAQNTIRKRDEMESLVPRADRTEAMEEVSWCFRCHCPGHWMGTCCGHSPKEYFDCYSFQIHDIVCDNDTFESISSKSITTIEELVFHVFYATRRLSQYGAFTRDRDDLVVDVIKKSATNEHIGEKANPFAKVRDVRPYEAFAAKACRLAHDLVEACMLAIRKLYLECVLPNSGFDKVDQAYPGDAQSLEKVYYNVMLSMRKSCLDARARLRRNTHYTSLKHLSIGKDLERYRMDVDSAYQHYTASLEELALEWSVLDSRYKLWKIRPTAIQRQAFTGLPFINLAINVEAYTERSIPTARFPPVEGLQYYYKSKES